MLPGGVPIEQPTPAHQVGVQPWSHKKRAFGIEHPSQALGHHSGCCKRGEVARHDHAGIAHRAIVSGSRFALDERDRKPAFQAVVGGAQCNHAAAHDDHSFGIHFNNLHAVSCVDL